MNSIACVQKYVPFFLINVSCVIYEMIASGGDISLRIEEVIVRLVIYFTQFFSL